MFKIINTLKKALKVEKPSLRDLDNSNRIITWDSHNATNNYPNEALKAITQSPTASACMSTRTSYIRGGGFNIADIGEIKVNKEETFESLHNGLSETVNKLKGIAIHVQRDIEGNIVQLTKMPFEDFRLSIPDEKGNVNSVVYNPRWMQHDFKMDENITYDLYTDNPVTYQERLNSFREANEGQKYKGEIYWKFIKKDGFPYYPYAFSQYDIKAFETDTAFTDFDYNNIFNNFFLGGVMNIVGDPNEQIKEKYEVSDGNGGFIEKERYIGTRGELFNREMQDNFGGGENAGKIMVHWKKSPEDNLDMSAFPINTNSDLFKETQSRVWNKIALITQVPNVLANIETAGKLGNSQEILNSIQLLNNSVNIQQSLLEQAYNELLPKHISFKLIIKETIKIQKLNPVSFLPDKVWDVIPNEDKLKYIKENYNIDIMLDEGNGVDEQKIVSRFGEFGVGGVNGILAIQTAVSNGIASYDSALATLKIIYGFKEENARKILGANADVITNPDGTEAPKKETNENITNLTGRQLQSIQRTVRKFKKGELTRDQAASLLKEGFGFDDEQVNVWLDDIDDNENVEIVEEPVKPKEDGV